MRATNGDQKKSLTEERLLHRRTARDVRRSAGAALTSLDVHMDTIPKSWVIKFKLPRIVGYILPSRPVLVRGKLRRFPVVSGSFEGCVHL